MRERNRTQEPLREEPQEPPREEPHETPAEAVLTEPPPPPPPPTVPPRRLASMAEIAITRTCILPTPMGLVFRLLVIGRGLDAELSVIVRNGVSVGLQGDMETKKWKAANIDTPTGLTDLRAVELSTPEAQVEHLCAKGYVTILDTATDVS